MMFLHLWNKVQTPAASVLKAHRDLVSANQCTFFLDHLPQVLACLEFRGSKDVSPAVGVGQRPARGLVQTRH